MDMIAAIDIGSQNTRVIIAEQKLDGGLNILGIGECESEGIQRGNIINIEKASLAVIKALKDAENIAGVKIPRCTASLGGDSLKWLKSHGIVAIPRDRKQIIFDDVMELLNSARAVVIPADHRIIASIVESYTVDTQKEIEDPVGMTGVRLEADVNIATLSRNNIENVVHILSKQRIDIEHFSLSIQGSAQSVLTEEEAELGALILDFGAGTIDIGIFHRKRLIFADVIRYAGASVTNDISVGLRTSFQQAEDLKIKYGHTIPDQIEDKETIEIQGIGGRNSRIESRRLLVKIIEARVGEILNMVSDRIDKGGMRRFLTAGVVITGGSALLPGIVTMSERIFGLPVRVGIAGEGTEIDRNVRTPFHSSTLGAILVTIEKQSLPEFSSSRNSGFFKNIAKSLRKAWMRMMMKK